MIVTNVGHGMRWTRQRQACRWLQGGLSGACERPDGALTTALVRTVKSCGPDSLWVGVKSRGGEAGPTGRGFCLNPRGDGDKQILIAGESTK